MATNLADGSVRFLYILHLDKYKFKNMPSEYLIHGVETKTFIAQNEDPKTADTNLDVPLLQPTQIIDDKDFLRSFPVEDQDLKPASSLSTLSDSTSLYCHPGTLRRQYNDVEGNETIEETGESGQVPQDGAIAAAYEVANAVYSLRTALEVKSQNGVLASVSPIEDCGQLQLFLKNISQLIKHVQEAYKRNKSQETEKTSSLEKSIQLLQEQLSNAKTVQNCMEAELKTCKRENGFLNQEINELAFRIGNHQDRKNRSDSSLSQTTQTTPSAHQVSFENAAVSETPESDMLCFQRTNIEMEVDHQCRTGRVRSILRSGSSTCNVLRVTSSSQTKLNGSKTNILRKREHDFDSIMSFVKARGTALDSLNNQLHKYDSDFQELQHEIYNVASEKMELQQAYRQLQSEHSMLVENQQNFQTLLDAITEERQVSRQSLETALEPLVEKLESVFGESKEVNAQFSGFKTALRALQDQNDEYCRQIRMLQETAQSENVQHAQAKLELDEALQNCNEAKAKAEQELKVALEKFEREKEMYIDEITRLRENLKLLRDQKAELEGLNNGNQERLKEVQAKLQKLAEKYDIESKQLQETEFRKQSLLQELQSLKQQVEQSTSREEKLRANLQNHRLKWAEKYKAIVGEADLARENCKWLQSQIEQMNLQIAEYREMVQKHDKDKVDLKKQVEAAEAERKVVDRKLGELKSALQGDAVIRSALVERNEALQQEINNLRQAKLFQTLNDASSTAFDALQKEESAKQTGNNGNGSSPDTANIINGLANGIKQEIRKLSSPRRPSHPTYTFTHRDS